MTNPEKEKKFYINVSQFMASTPNSDKLIIMGDFNARVRKIAHPVSIQLAHMELVRRI